MAEGSGPETNNADIGPNVPNRALKRRQKIKDCLVLFDSIGASRPPDGVVPEIKIHREAEHLPPKGE
jgi:hypothetical protein